MNTRCSLAVLIAALALGALQANAIVLNWTHSQLYTSITEAVAQALNRDIIYISTGTYNETAVIMGKSLTLEGGCHIQTFPTVAAYKIPGAMSYVTHSSGVGTALDIVSSTSLVMSIAVTGVTSFAISVRNGAILTARYCQSAFNQATTFGNGGGLCVLTGAAAVLEHTDISSNSALFSGGGIYVEQATVTLKSNSVVAANAAITSGGGICLLDATAILSDVTLLQNAAGVSGGAVSLSGGDLTATNTLFAGNSTAGDGGALYADLGTATLDTCLMASNSALAGGAVSWAADTCILRNNSALRNNQALDGGALNATTGSVECISSVVAENVAGNGGGVRAVGGGTRISLTACLLELNQATNSDELVDQGGGGALAMDGAELVAVNCRFLNNASSLQGGAINCNAARLVVTSDFSQAVQGLDGLAADFTSNSAAVGGGALFIGGALAGVQGSSALVADSSFLWNSANAGGALGAGPCSTCDIVNCLIIRNSATNEGDGVAVGSSSEVRLVYCTIAQNEESGVEGGTASLTNCIVWGHSALQVSPSNDIQYSDIEGGYASGVSNLNAYPQFTDTDALHYTLLDLSPCTETGVLVPGIDTDGTGGPRVIGLAPGLGPFETIPEPLGAGMAAVVALLWLNCRRTVCGVVGTLRNAIA